MLPQSSCAVVALVVQGIVQLCYRAAAVLPCSSCAGVALVVQGKPAEGAPGLGNPEDIPLLKAAHFHSDVAVPYQLHMTLKAVYPILLLVAVLLPRVNDQHQLQNTFT